MVQPANLASSATAALALTVLVEVGVGRLRGYRTGPEVSAIILINLVTNPALNLIMWLNAGYQPVSSAVLLLLLEAAVVAIEAGLLAFALGFRLRRTLVDSLWLNAASAGLGVVLYLGLR